MTTMSTSATSGTPPAGRAIMQVTDLWKTYGEGETMVHALRGVDLTVHAKDFIAIMGPSGSGKSTLMNMLGCLDRPTRGSYLLDGRDVAQLSGDALAEVRNKALGFVFQAYCLLPRTSALENVQLPLLYAGVPRRQLKERATEALVRVGLGARLDHTPAQLSGGQQQRVAIARAIVSRPKVILADEPTGNLDSRTTIEILALFQELAAEGITIVFVTHEPEVAAHASRLVVVKDGKVVADKQQVPLVARPSDNPDHDVIDDALRAADAATRAAAPEASP
jgi:putative ABC transport system ATP-binding protein